MTRFQKLFVITVCSFALTNYPAGSIGFLARYGSLVLLVVGVVVTLGEDFRSRGVRLILPAFALFLLECLITGFWSQNFELSIVKLMVYSLTTIGLFLGGVRFSQSREAGANPFLPLGYVFVSAVATSVPTLFFGGGFADGNFRGITGNSNTLGAMIALSSPWLLFELNRGLGRRWRKWGLIALTVFAMVCLFLTYSRSSIGTFALICLFALRGMRLSRRLLVLYTVASVLILALAFNEGLYHAFYEKIVLKRSESVMESRRDQMETSWAAAKQGGVLGLGFGVSAGESRYWTFGSFSRSAREKGSSQMAILEETGVVGFALYLGFLLCTLLFLLKGWRLPGMAFLGALSTAFFLAGILHSMFEAWFLATGPESAFFWAGLGLAVGALDQVTVRANVLEYRARAILQYSR